MTKFLIIRLSSIGDIVLTTPVVRCLKQQVKDAEVHFCVRQDYADVLKNNPFIDKIVFLNDDLSELTKRLKNEKYDYIIDLHRNIRTKIIKRKLGTKSFSFDKLNFKKWLLVNFRINRLPPVHIVDRYLKSVQSFHVKNDGQGLDYFISIEDEKVIESLPPVFKNGYIGFVIAAKHFTKQLPSEKIISICLKINQPIILLGGPEDVKKAEEIIHGAHRLKSDSIIFNSCGKFSINQSAALVKHATKIITHDTGLMHIAAAFKKNILTVWGNTIPELGMYPYYGTNKTVHEQRFEIKNLYCRPCSKIGFKKCPQQHFRCMLEQNETAIAEAITS
jgi:ADP-heptose:LPS heptosyltransferase